MNFFEFGRNYILHSLFKRLRIKSQAREEKETGFVNIRKDSVL